MSTHLGTNSCPTCGRDHTEAVKEVRANAPDFAPRPGDVGICIGCAAVFRYCEGGSIRPVSPEEIQSLEPKHRELLKLAQEVIKAALDRRRSRLDHLGGFTSRNGRG